MSCTRYTPQDNTVESKLFDQLFEITKDENAAEELYGYFREGVFKDMFEYKDQKGEYTLYSGRESDSVLDRTDENNEPKLELDEVLNKTYFLDKDFERVYYPYNQGLSTIFEVDDIRMLTQTMALKFYEQLTFDFDKKTFLNLEGARIRTIVEDFLSTKTDELMADLDPFVRAVQGESLEVSKKYTNEWIQLVKDFYKSKGLIIKKDQIDEIETQNDTDASTATRGDLFRQEAFTSSRKDTVNNNVKLWLSLLKSSEKNYYGEYDFIPFDDVYTTLNTILADIIPGEYENGEIENIYDVFKDRISRYAKFKPYLGQLHSKLDQIENPNFKYQLVNAFFLARKKFLNSDIIIKKGKYTYDIKDISQVSSRKKGVLSEWLFQIDLQNISYDEFKDLQDDLFQLAKKLNKNKTARKYSTTFDSLLEHLDGVGVTLTPDALDYHIDINFGEELEEKIEGLIETLEQLILAIDTHDPKKRELKEILSNSAFVKLASAESFFLTEGSDAAFFSANKNKWLYSLYSHLEKTILEWKKDPTSLEKHLDSSAYTRGSFYGEYLMALEVDEDQREQVRQDRINDIEAFVFNAVQIKNDSINAADNKDIFYVDSIADHINKMFNGLKTNGKTYTKTALAADKATEYQLAWGTDTSVFALKSKSKLVGNTFETSTEVKNIFWKYFTSEYYRMTEVHNDIEEGTELTIHYHTKEANGKLSHLFPSLSPVFNKDGVASNPRITLDGKVYNPIIYDKAGKPIYENLDSMREEIMPIILDSLKQNVLYTQDVLKQSRITYYDVNGYPKFQGIDQTILQAYQTTPAAKKNLTKEEMKERVRKIEAGTFNLVADFTINSIISQIEYSKLISGDVAYYKSIVDYKKRIPSTYTDGQYLTLLNGAEKHFNAAVINKVEFATPQIESLRRNLPKAIADQYESVNSADAQAWITPERWIFIMKRLGKWNDTMESLAKKMYQDKPKFTISELKVLAQPLKGVYYSNINGKPVFMKYSQAVLLPRLIKGTGLGKLYDAMKRAGTDELITLDGMKVGATDLNLTHDPETGKVLDNITLTNMQLNNKNWKLQQDLPTKGIKPRELGSQIQKNIFQGLAFNLAERFDVGGRELSGAETIVYINDLFGAMSAKGISKFANQLGLDENFIIQNEDGLFRQLLTQFETRENPSRNIVDALHSKTVPFGVPAAYNIFQTIFSSMANKASVKIKTNGGGFIQMSDYGLSKSEAIEQGVIFTPWFNDDVLNPPILGINPVTGKEVIQPGGIFLSGSVIAKHIPNYASMPSKQLFGEYNAETGRYEGGKIDDRILRNIIGYRIPNQAIASNDHLQIMGILPEEIGDTVIAYTGITEKTGSDFDIDKMYLMMAAFEAVYSKETDNNPYFDVLNYMQDNDWTDEKVRTEIFKIGEAPSGTTEESKLEDRKTVAAYIMKEPSYEYFDAYAEWAKKPAARRLEYIEVDPKLSLEEQSEGALQNKLIEAYKGVLGHPKVYEQLMNPIEVPHIKNDIKSLLPKQEKVNLQDFSSIYDLKIKSSFRVGKSGLGQAINFLVDSVRGSMGELTFIEDSFVWGNKMPSGETVFDKRYSEDLTPDEKKAYIKHFNKFKDDTAPTLDKELMDLLTSLELAESFMGIVNGFVDIANDEYIVSGNWNLSTNALGFSLLRAGVHPFKINAFLNQPILKEFNEFSNTLNSKNVKVKGNIEHLFKHDKFIEGFEKAENITVEGTTKNFYELTKKIFTYARVVKKINFNSEALYESTLEDRLEVVREKLYEEFGLSEQSSYQELEDIMETYETNFNELFNSEPIDFDEFSLLDLREQVTNPEKTSIDTQIGIFEIYLNWLKKGKQVSKIVKANRADTDGKGKNITSNISSLNLIEDVINSVKEGTVGGYRSILNFKGRPTITQHAIANGVSFPFKIMQANSKFFPTASPVAVRTFNMISRLLGEDKLSGEELGDKLEKAYYSYIMGGLPALDLTSNDKALLINQMPTKLEAMRKKYPTNALLKELQLTATPNAGKYYITMSSTKKTTGKKDNMTDAWRELMLDEEEFANDLVKYSYVESSFNQTLTQFHDVIPYQWFNRNRLNAYLKNLDLNSYNVDWNFVDQFFRNNLEMDNVSDEMNYSFTIWPNNAANGEYLMLGPVINKKNVGRLKYLMYKGEEEENPYSLSFGDYFSMGEEEQAPETKWFKLTGLTASNRPIYVRTTPLGSVDELHNKFSEYSINTIDNKQGLKSMWKANLDSVRINAIPSERINIAKMQEVTETYSVYNLPRELKSNLDTRPIEFTDMDDASALTEEKESILTSWGKRLESARLEASSANFLMPDYYEGFITPSDETVFVFGSNPEGKHGKGAAKIAVDKFGATYGKGEGLQGGAYALPTKDLKRSALLNLYSPAEIKKFADEVLKPYYETHPYSDVMDTKFERSISPLIIAMNISNMYVEARKNPNKLFKIGYTNAPNEETLNAYLGGEMIEIFNSVGVAPDNVIFSKTWFDSGLLIKKESENLDISEKSGILGEENNNEDEDGFDVCPF
jgi:hypothetical protein